MKPLIKFNHISKVKTKIDKLLSDFDDSSYKYRDIKISTMTKKILKEMVKRDTKEKELKKIAYKLEPTFYDEIFENFLTLEDKEQKKFVELISLHKKRIFKSKIYQNILLNYNHHNTKKMAYVLTDKFKPNILMLPHAEFVDIVESPNNGYIYYKKSLKKGLFRFVQQLEPTCESPLSVKVLKSLLTQSGKVDYSSRENDLLYDFLVNHFTDDEGAKYGLQYLRIFNTKSYDSRIVSFIIKCKNNIQHKYRELADELDLLLYQIYEYSLIYDDYADIADELAMTLTDKIISEAFGDDERSQFWKRYSRSIIEPIVFVRRPVEMFMMKFKEIGIVEYIDTGNATYLLENEKYSDIKNRILASSRNERDILNIYSYLTTTQMKNVTKVGNNRYIHRGYWMGQFKRDMKRNYGVIEEL